MFYSFSSGYISSHCYFLGSLSNIGVFTLRARERALNEFIDHRFIPQSRSNYDVIKALYKAEDAFELSLRSYMVSISDHYWVKPCDSSVTWSDVNFYDNPIPDD